MQRVSTPSVTKALPQTWSIRSSRDIGLGARSASAMSTSITRGSTQDAPRGPAMVRHAGSTRNSARSNFAKCRLVISPPHANRIGGAEITPS